MDPSKLSPLVRAAILRALGCDRPDNPAPHFLGIIRTMDEREAMDKFCVGKGLPPGNWGEVMIGAVDIIRQAQKDAQRPASA